MLGRNCFDERKTEQDTKEGATLSCSADLKGKAVKRGSSGLIRHMQSLASSGIKLPEQELHFPKSSFFNIL